MIMGSSLGGLISLYALCEYPHVFGAAAGLSTHWIGTTSIDNGDIPRGLITYISDNLPKADLKENCIPIMVLLALIVYINPGKYKLMLFCYQKVMIILNI